MIPLGAAAKEHGPHLRLDNDLTLANYFRDRVLADAEVVDAADRAVSLLSAFVEYPARPRCGSTPPEI